MKITGLICTVVALALTSLTSAAYAGGVEAAIEATNSQFSAAVVRAMEQASRRCIRRMDK